MMKGMFKKALAGVAAAALAATGFAAATTSAMADPVESITIQNSQNDSTYMAYRFAAFSNIQSTGSKIDQVDVTTVGTAGDGGMFDAVAAAATTANGSLDAPYTQNPAALVATFDASTLRAFADAFVFTGLTADGSAEGVDGQSVQITGLEPGWYLVTDSQGKVMVVTSTITGYETMTINGVENTLGVIVAKSDNPTEPSKTAEEKDELLGVGSEVNFTISTYVPYLAGMDTTNFKHVVIDTPSLGLTVEKSDVKVYVADETSATEITVDDQTVHVSEITLTDGDFEGFDEQGVFVGDGSKYFSVKLTDWMESNQQYAGATVYVQYKATINSDVQESTTVSNTPAIDNGGEDWIEGDKVEIKVGKLAFHKYGVDKDVNGLADGVKFQVFADDSAEGTPLEFVKVSDGRYVLADADDTNAVTEIEPAQANDAENGVTVGDVSISGLAAGNYTFKETSFADGYSEQFTPVFTINVSLDETGAVDFDLVDLNNDNDLADQDEVTGVIKVKNVKNITQLPQTGAAGIAMFVVIGLLIAGVGVSVYMKSRNVRNAMRG